MRPKLSNSLAYDDFLDYYWLKEELVVFCRNSSIPSGGAKKELSLLNVPSQQYKHEQHKTGHQKLDGRFQIVAG